MKTKVKKENKMIKAIVTHKSEKMVVGLMAELEKIKSKNPEVDIQLSVIGDFISDWANKNRIGPEEILAIYFQEEKGEAERKRRTKSTFSVNMMSIDQQQQPEWVNSPCWIAVLHNSDNGVVRAMAGQLWGDYIRNFNERTRKGWAPWGALPENSSWALPGAGNEKGIEVGKMIDKAFVKCGLIYDSDLSTTWMPGIEYFEITQTQFEVISKLMEASFHFKEALVTLYRENEWARGILNIGRPSFIFQWALGRMVQDSIPKKFRLDIAIDEQGKPWVTELDGTPGGEGIEMGLRRIYLDVLGKSPRGYLPLDVAHGYEMMIKEAAISGPIMFLISPDASQYFLEQKLKAKILTERGIKIIVCRPEDVVLDRGDVLAKGERMVAWDRFVETYELFDPYFRSLAEVSENGKGFFAFPPFRNFFWEGKETFAFLHESRLTEFWKKEMGVDNFNFLKEHTPLTLFPIHGEILQKGNWYRKRASMGDNQCWGSRGVCFGGREGENEWERQFWQDKENFLERTFPYHVYQKAIPHFPYRMAFYNRSQERVIKGKLFVRLTPWGYSVGDRILTCGMVATLRNDPKVHGAKDSVQTVSVIIPD